MFKFNYFKKCSTYMHMPIHICCFRGIRREKEGNSERHQLNINKKYLILNYFRCFSLKFVGQVQNVSNVQAFLVTNLCFTSFPKKLLFGRLEFFSILSQSNFGSFYIIRHANHKFLFDSLFFCIFFNC